MALKSKFAWSVLTLQLFFVVIFAIFTKYGKDLDATYSNHDDLSEVAGQKSQNNSLRDYPMFQDINALIFIGVGYLYAFLKRYSYTGVGMNFLLCAIGVQWGIIAGGWWEMKDGKIEISVGSLIRGEYAAVSGVIAMGGIFGKVGTLQMITFIIIDIFMYTVLNHCREEYLQVADAGESVALHLFSAVFGCSAAYIIDKKVKVKDNPNEGNSYNSNLFCILGTLVIWVFWPSFNAAACDEVETQHRCIINTFFALIGSGITCFATSALLDKENKFTMSHIQNAALAGAVAVGSVSDLMIQPFTALSIGALGGCLSVAGFKYFSPFLARLGIYDPCGINSLHGLPGFFGGIIAVLATFIANAENYGSRLYKFYPAMAPVANTTVLNEIPMNASMIIQPGLGRTMQYQAFYQFIYIFGIIAASSLSGMITGALLRLKIFDPIQDKNMYLDDVMWNLPDVEADQEKHDFENRMNPPSKTLQSNLQN